MCLYYNDELTKKQQQRKKPFVAYKVYYVGKPINKLSSPFYMGNEGGCIEKAGTYESSKIQYRALSGKTKDVSCLKEDVGIPLDISGFHSFIYKEAVKFFLECNYLDIVSCVIVEVIINPKDIVAAGLTVGFNPITQTVVSNRITITPEEFKNHVPLL